MRLGLARPERAPRRLEVVAEAAPVAEPGLEARRGGLADAGAGAAVLIASGVHTSQAIAFSIAAQMLGIFAGAAIVGAAGIWTAGRRLVPARV